MVLIHIIHDLRRAKGRNAKMDILLREQDNKQWKKFLQYVYDPRKVYHISSPSSTSFNDADVDDQMFEIFDQMNERKISGNGAKSWAETLNRAYGEIPRLILGRSIKAGISTTSINTAYPGLIFEFNTMKGKDIPIHEYPVWSSIKYDGNKIFVTVNSSGNVKIQTSAGNEFRLKSLEYEFGNGVIGVYEGELIHGLGRQIDRPIISGKVNSLLSGTIDDIDGYSFMVYDYIHLGHWENKKSIHTYHERMVFLSAIMDNSIQDSAYVKQVVQVIHQIEDQMIEYNEDLILRGYEGSMHRYPGDVYEWTGEKRTDRLIKKKSIRECVLTCVGTKPHSNPLKGVTGSLLCEGIITDKNAGRVFVTANAGTLNKMEIMRDHEHWVGKDVEVLYNSVTQTDEGNSLFLPRFKRIKGEL